MIVPAVVLRVSISNYCTPSSSLASARDKRDETDVHKEKFEGLPSRSNKWDNFSWFYMHFSHSLVLVAFQELPLRVNGHYSSSEDSNNMLLLDNRGTQMLELADDLELALVFFHKCFFLLLGHFDLASFLILLPFRDSFAING